MLSLNENEFAPYYKTYINVAIDNEQSIVDNLKMKLTAGLSFLEDIPANKYNYKYAEDKWTVKDLLQHIIDTERIFSYRALAFARNDITALPGFDQDVYALNSKAEKKEYKDLLEEFEIVRNATISLFKSFDETTMKRIGSASGNPMSVRAAAYIILGHQEHHLKIVKERYL